MSKQSTSSFCWSLTQPGGELWPSQRRACTPLVLFPAVSEGRLSVTSLSATGEHGVASPAQRDPQALFPACPLQLLPQAVRAPLSNCLKPSTLAKVSKQETPPWHPVEHLNTGASFFQVKSAPQMGPQPSCPICHQGAVQTTAQDNHSFLPGPGSCVWYLQGQLEPTLKCVGPFGFQPFFIPKMRGAQRGGEPAKGGPGEGS